MKPSIYRISLDVHDAHSGVCLDMKQRDTARQIDITLTDAGFPYQISEECYAVFAATKADGKRIRHNCNIRNNIIQYIVRTQTTAAVGPMECEIKLYGAGDKLLMSPGFSILVSENAVTNDEELESEDEVDDLTKLISEATTVITEGKNINSRSEKLIEEMETEKETLEDKAAEAKGAAENAQSMAESAGKFASDAEKAAHLAQKYSTRPDLSQNNPDEPGYIKNRTHWVESSETVIAWDGNVMGTRTYTDALGKIYYKISDKCPEESDVVGATIEFSDGKILTVSTKMFNGYTEGHAAVGGYIYLRKTPVVYPGNMFDPHDVGVYAAIINDVYPAVFRYGKNVVHTLDEKFIPDTIARKDDLEQAAGEKLNKSGFNPNKYLGTDAAGNVVETESPDSGQSIFVVPDGGNVEDAPPEATIIIDPNGEADPPAGDASLNVTGAAVGQTVKIAAVDENGAPTAWEPVDLPSGGSAEWELVADVTLEEDTKAIEYTDLNAQDLRFSFEGRFNNAADDMANANAEVYFHLSNNTWGVPIGKGMFGYVRPTDTFIGVGEAKVMAGFGYVRSMVLGGGLYAAGQADSGRPHDLNVIPRFKMETAGDYLFKAGGKFKLYKKA